MRKSLTFPKDAFKSRKQCLFDTTPLGTPAMFCQPLLCIATLLRDPLQFDSSTTVHTTKSHKHSKMPPAPQYTMTIASKTGVNPHPLNIAYHLNVSLLLVIKLRKVKSFSFTSTIHALKSQNILHVTNQKCNEIQTIETKYLWFLIIHFDL